MSQSRFVQNRTTTTTIIIIIIIIIIIAIITICFIKDTLRGQPLMMCAIFPSGATSSAVLP